MTNNKIKRSKSAIYFSFDAILGGLIFIAGLVLISQFSIQEIKVQHIETYGRDVADVLNTITISEVSDPLIQAEILNGNITDLNNSVLVQIGEYWATNQTEKAENLSRIVISEFFPAGVDVNISIENDTIYFTNRSIEKKEVVRIQRMVSGIAEGAPIEGSTASSYLRKIRDKRTSSFAYFGGFVGQGIITTYMYDIPDDVSAMDVTEIIVELDTSEDFNISINDIFCTNLTFSEGNQTANVWDITGCNASIQNGTNKFVLDYTQDLNTAFIGGGFIKVSYKTDQFLENISLGSKRYYLPGIDGIINLYDAFYVPGTLNSMTLYLHYLADHTNSSNTFYFTIGNNTIFRENTSTTEQFLTFNSSNLSNYLNFSEFDRQTVPIRVGFENLTFNSEFVGNADVALVTDVSGSMERRMDSGSTGSNYDCDQLSEPDINRISVAKCLDKQFVSDILNYTGNKVGLITYDTTTNAGDTVNPTTDEAALNTSIDTYSPQSRTCICCGIYSARDILITDITVTERIDRQQTWNYTEGFVDGEPANDTNSNAWYSIDYIQDGSWTSGQAALGYDDGSNLITLNTALTITGAEATAFGDLWDLAADSASPVVDFTSGLNSTANTFGLGAGDDGWDWDAGVYGYESNTNDYDFNGAVSGELEFDTRTSPGNDNNCGSYDCSAAYGVEVNIDTTLWNLINSAGGTAIVSFYYEWDGNDNPFENSDEVWIKSRWTSPYSGGHYLGTEMSSSGFDFTLEVDRRNNPNTDFSGTHSQDITSWIEGPGNYYLDIGGKLRASASNEWGDFRFDNVLLIAYNGSDNYYFRKEFTVSDTDDVGRAFINIVEDDYLTLYLNGNIIYDKDYPNNTASYWTENGIDIPRSYFVAGKNVVAAKSVYAGGFSGFDMELKTVNDSKVKALLMMTDGQANEECVEAGTTGDLDADGFSDTSSDDAIQAACDVAEEYGIISYSVGYSTEADTATINKIAECGKGVSAQSTNITALQAFYSNVVFSILEAARQGQSVVIGGGSWPNSTLFPDSYIEVNYTPIISEPGQNQISVVFQSDQFSSCNESIFIFEGLNMVDARVTSYSGEHWTDLVTVNGNIIFNLSEYNHTYNLLGDPYTIDIPADIIVPGAYNNITIRTGDDINNSFGCSLNNSLIYSATFDSATPRSGVVENIIGCNWNIEFEDGSFLNLSMPSSYAGNNNCSYTNASISYNQLDAYDLGVYNILNQLDFDDDGRVLVNIAEEDLEIIVTLVSSVPFLWGPSLVEVEVWK